MATNKCSLKQAIDWAKAEAKGRFEQRKHQLSVDLMYDRISQSEYKQMLKTFRAEYEAELKDIDNMFK